MVRQDKKSSNDIINDGTMSDDEAVASDVPPAGLVFWLAGANMLVTALRGIPFPTESCVFFCYLSVNGCSYHIFYVTIIS